MAAFNALEAALEQQDIEAALACCTEDVVFIGSGEGEEAVGRAAIKEMVRTLGSETADTSFRIVWDDVEIELFGAVALLRAFGSATFTSPRRTAAMRYRLTGVLTRVEERWLWHVHHGSEPAAW
jgi:uncharacterized protein (TIGR02246 family)